MTLQQHFNQLLEKHWSFLEQEWPYIQVSTNNRTVNKEITFMKTVKKTLMARLGAIPVFFFLTIIWPNGKYPGPYRKVEKGLVLLYHLVKGASMEQMSPFLPKSSFFAIYSMFYKTEYSVHDKFISLCLENMFSTITIRLLSATKNNPPLFKHVTLHLDGHDTRATYQGETSAEMYSYKLKKSGLRTQVVMDCNGMALWVSKSASCKNYADGTMLLSMKMDKKIHAMDCVAVDGGYTQFLKTLVEMTDLTLHNFTHPFRKKKHQDLTLQESEYNSTFGSFRSQIEALFGELGSVFERHNNRAPVITEKKKTYTLQMKLALLLLNIKRMVALLKLETEPIHTSWMRDEFDYPTENQDVEQPMVYFPINALVDDGKTMARMQEEFLEMAIGDEDITMDQVHQHSSIGFEVPRWSAKRKANAMNDKTQDDGEN